jgi:ABC-type glycerol-3-phosphate transport system substrate-binding protein
MKKLWVAILGSILMTSTVIGANRVSASQARSSSAAPATKITGCTGKGTVNYMFWGDSGDNAAHLASIKLAEKNCKGLHVNPIWDSGNYDTDLATKVGSGNAPDLFQLDASKRIPEYVSLGALTPIDSYVKKYNIKMKQTYWGH